LRNGPGRGDTRGAEITEQKFVAGETGKRLGAAIRLGSRRAGTHDSEIRHAAQDPALLAGRDIAVEDAHDERRTALKSIAKGIGEVRACLLLFGRGVGACRGIAATRATGCVATGIGAARGATRTTGAPTCATGAPTCATRAAASAAHAAAGATGVTASAAGAAA
jgi:hypothetical protein